MTAETYLFNFAASYTGGGSKRLTEYARMFNDGIGRPGVAHFLINPHCEALLAQYPNNQYFVIRQSRYRRLFDDYSYVRDIVRRIGTPDLYYSYAIPIYVPTGRVNWFQLTNALTIGTRKVPLHPLFRLKMAYLGAKYRAHFDNADVIGGESEYTLSLIPSAYRDRSVLSLNGADDELAYLRAGTHETPDDLATAVGTYTYKGLSDVYRVFEMLKQDRPALRLALIGDATDIPRWIRERPDVVVHGSAPRPKVIEQLKRSRYYLSATYIEGSYNAAAEGAFLAAESYLSDIGPHRELLRGERFEAVRVAGVDRALLRVRRDELTGRNLRTWREVTDEMLAEVNAMIAECAA